MIVADASWIIALRDPHDQYHALAVALDDATADEDVLLHPVTLAECLVAPAKLGVLHQAAAALRAAYEVAEVDADAPVRWAALRASTGVRLPDAIVIDTAVATRAAVATFDDQLARTASAHGLAVRGAAGHELTPPAPR